MTEWIAEALASIAPRGTFAVEQTCSADDLEIAVKGVGPLRFPISTAAARALCAVARPAPFGQRDLTLYDRGVRDTWEIPGRHVKIDVRRWKRTLEPALAHIREKLGLPEGGKLVAKLDKMLIYTPGQFFAAHQDSERADEMVASLVVQLPSRSSGGGLIVQHGKQKKVFRGESRGEEELSLLAFYADCHHEVKPISAGHRVVLTYHLLHQPAAKPRAAAVAAPPRALETLVHKVAAHFSTPVFRGYGSTTAELPDRLVYLLDHEYTEKSLGWTRLKSADRLRVSALLQAAERLDCEAYLTLADVHENWTCEEEDFGGYGWRGRSHRRYEDDDDDRADGFEPELGELCDSEIELCHWIGRDGPMKTSVPVSPEADELCFTKASVDMEPFRTKHEGYMGNYGNTVDRWYHRAALVMWPRARTFVIRAKASPSWAVGELTRRVQGRDLASARDDARSLLPSWKRYAPRDDSATFFPRLLKLTLALDDAELASGLLAPFGPSRLELRALTAFSAVVERYGAPWARGVFTTWFEHQRLRHDAQPLHHLAALFEDLQKRAPTHGRPLAAWLLAHEVNLCKASRTAASERPQLWLDAEEEDESDGKQSGVLVGVLEAARAIGATSERDGLVRILTTGKTALTALHGAELLRACHAARPPSAVRQMGLQALYDHVVGDLECTLGAPARSRDDWSIDLPLPCQCSLCNVLSAFLRDRSRVEHRWPLAKDRRRHIHDAIGRHRLPVTHVTLRIGSPHVLVLTKQKTLFSGEVALRARHAKLLAWLKQHRGAFTDAAAEA